MSILLELNALLGQVNGGFIQQMLSYLIMGELSYLFYLQERFYSSLLTPSQFNVSLIHLTLLLARKKKSEISIDFSAIFRFSVGVEKKIHGKNRLKKFRRKIAIFRKNPIFPEIWDKLYFRSLREKKLKTGGQTKLQN